MEFYSAASIRTIDGPRLILDCALPGNASVTRTMNCSAGRAGGAAQRPRKSMSHTIAGRCWPLLDMMPLFGSQVEPLT